jgi:FkbM family methyltransferase
LPEKLFVRQTSSDIQVLHELFELGVYDPIRGWQLPPNPIILDLGGNIGLATLYFSTLFPDATVVVVEPDPTNLQVLEMNCGHLMKANKVIVTGAFIGARDGIAGIDRTGESWAFRKVDLTGRADAQAIECLSVPSVLRLHGITQLDLLKCDIEGSEAELFASCREWIHRVQYLVVETHKPYSLHSLYADLDRASWSFTVLRSWEADPIAQCFLQRSATSESHVGGPNLARPY